MGNEDGSQELPQRSRGAARGGSDRSAPSASPVLSEELRQRIQAAVKAERAEAAAGERSAPTERSGRETGSPSAAGPAAVSAVNGTGGARKHERAARSERLSKPDALGKPERAAGRKAAVKAEPGEKLERAAKNGTGVKLQAATEMAASHKPVAPGHGRTSARGRASLPGQAEESARKKPPGQRLAQVRLVALALVLGAVGALATVASLHTANSPSKNSGVSSVVLQHQEALARQQAASWVTQQVNPADMVSCDQAMCHALKAAGFPGQLLVLGPASPPPVTSVVVVVTQVVRDLFGSSIDSAWAPAILASIGSGAAEVTIRVIAPHGAVTYQAQLKSGLAERTQDGGALQGSPQIKLSDSARANLAAGQVDPRLLLALVYLAGHEPIDIVRFGNAGPGASAGLLLRYADLDVDGKAANMSSQAYVQAMHAFLSKANPQIRPARSQPVVLPSGRIFRVGFTAPSPLTPIGGNP